MPQPFHFCYHCGASDPTPVSEREFHCAACGRRHYITPIPAAVAVLIDSQDRVLVIRRAHEPGLGLLGMPGGVIEPDETGEMAAARETREEVGLDISPQAFTQLCTLNNRYRFQGYLWPTIDLCYFARVESFEKVQIDPAEVQEWYALPFDRIPFDQFAFESNAEAVRAMVRHVSVR